MDSVITKALRTAVEAERHGAAFYSGLADKYSGNSELSVIFRLLSKDEAKHREQFEELLLSIDDNSYNAGPVDCEFLGAIDIAGHFPDMSDGGRRMEPEQALLSACSFEKETALFYMAIRGVIGNSPQLDAIIESEKQHVNQLQKIISSGVRFTLEARAQEKK